MIAGFGLGKEQSANRGGILTTLKEDIKFRSHTIESSVNAEELETFMPSPGKIR